MDNVLNRIKNYEGCILGIGIKEQIVKDVIWNNHKIYKCDLLEDIKEKNEETTSLETYKKVVQIKNLYQTYRKNKMDYILCNIDGMTPYLPYIWRDAFAISKKEICFYGTFTKEEIPIFLKRCKRYSHKIKQIKGKKCLFFFIEKEKVPRYKSYLYFWLDRVNLFLDKISEILEQ